MGTYLIVPRSRDRKELEWSSGVKDIWGRVMRIDLWEGAQKVRTRDPCERSPKGSPCRAGIQWGKNAPNRRPKFAANTFLLT